MEGPEGVAKMCASCVPWLGPPCLASITDKTLNSQVDMRQVVFSKDATNISHPAYFPYNVTLLFLLLNSDVCILFQPGQTFITSTKRIW